MPLRSRARILAIALMVLSAPSTPAEAQVQPPLPKHAALIDAVTSNPGAAPQLTAREVAAGDPSAAPPIVGEVVTVLPSGQQLSLAPRVVSAAIAALPAPQRAPQAPACACAAIRALPPAEQSRVAPAIVTAAVAIAPTARPQIVSCAIEAVPALAAAITAAAGPAPIQAELASPPTSPLPGSTIGRDVLFSGPQTQICASPPCP